MLKKFVPLVLAYILFSSTSLAKEIPALQVSDIQKITPRKIQTATKNVLGHVVSRTQRRLLIINEIIDDDDDVGQRFELELFFLVHCLARLAVVAGVNGAGERLALVARFGNAQIVAVEIGRAPV